MARSAVMTRNEEGLLRCSTIQCMHCNSMTYDTMRCSTHPSQYGMMRYSTMPSSGTCKKRETTSRDDTMRCKTTRGETKLQREHNMCVCVYIDIRMYMPHDAAHNVHMYMCGYICMYIYTHDYMYTNIHIKYAQAQHEYDAIRYHRISLG